MMKLESQMRIAPTQRPMLQARSLLWCSIGVGHPFDGVSAILEIHDGHSRNFADATAEIFIASGDDVALVLSHSLRDAVVGVRALVHAWKTLEPGRGGAKDGFWLKVKRICFY